MRTSPETIPETTAQQVEGAARRTRSTAGFTDSFTASTQRIYETHKVLIAERVVEAIVGDELASFRVHDEREERLQRA